MTIAFSNASPKIPKSGFFGSKFKDFFGYNFEGADFKCDIDFFSNSSAKIPKQNTCMKLPMEIFQKWQ